LFVVANGVSSIQLGERFICRLTLPEFVLSLDFNVGECFGLRELDTISRAEYKQLEEERRSSTATTLQAW